LKTKSFYYLIALLSVDSINVQGFDDDNPKCPSQYAVGYVLCLSCMLRQDPENT